MVNMRTHSNKKHSLVCFLFKEINFHSPRKPMLGKAFCGTTDKTHDEQGFGSNVIDNFDVHKKRTGFDDLSFFTHY